MSDKKHPIEFEKAFTELENLVQRMEAGDQSLEKSVDDFQAGMNLIKTLQEQLLEAEQKVDILLKDSNGELHAEPFQTEAD